MCTVAADGCVSTTERRNSRKKKSLTAFTQLQVWNRYKLSVYMRMAPNTFGVFAVRAHARSIGIGR